MDNMTEQIDSIAPEAEATAEMEKPAILLTRQPGLKRLFKKRVTSIYISDVSIKLMVARGREIEKWVTAPLDSGLVVNGIVTDPESLGTKVSGLLREYEIKSNKVIAGLSGLNSITRIITIPGVPAKVIKEAIYHEAERELPVPLDSVYLSWQIIRETYQEMKVLLIAYARNAIDPLMNALKKAGITPYFLELAPLALARSVNHPTSVVFDVRPGEMDIVVMIDNIPELSRSVPLPVDNSSEESLPIILDELLRTMTFCQSVINNDVMPVFAFGELDYRTRESLSVALDHSVVSSYPPLYYPPEFLPNTYSVNLGLVLGKVKLSDAAYSRKVKVNLLPETFRERKLSPQVRVAAGATLALGILAAVFFQFQAASTTTESLRNQVAAADKVLAQRQAERLVLQRQADTLAEEATQAAREWDTYSGSLDTLTTEQASINNNLKLVLKALPSGVSLSGIQEASDLVVQGNASTEAEVLAYTRNLENSERFSEIILSMSSESSPSGDGGITFKMQLRNGE